MRIALFSGNYNYVRDGANRALNRLVSYLETQGVEVLVFSPTSATPAFAPAGTLVSVPSVPVPLRPEYRIAMGLPESVKKRIAAFKPDLIHLSAPDLLGYGALRYAHKNGIPAIASFHTRFDTYFTYYGLPWLDRVFTKYLGHFYRLCERVYAPSESMAQEMRTTKMGRDIRIWSRGVDSGVFNPSKRSLDWRRAQGIEDDDVVMAFVGRLVLEKGLDVFSKVSETLTRQGKKHKVLVVGDGPEREKFAKQFPSAIFTGFLSGDELSRAYASSDFFLNPSTTETFGNVTLEAMATGLPVICANATGSQSLVDHGNNGFLCEPNTLEDYTSYASQLIDDKVLRSNMALASLNLSQAYDWDQVMHQLMVQYSEVIETGDQQGPKTRLSPAFFSLSDAVRRSLSL